jgi:hypothetical protein
VQQFNYWYSKQGKAGDPAAAYATDPLLSQLLNHARSMAGAVTSTRSNDLLGMLRKVGAGKMFIHPMFDGLLKPQRG